MSAFVLDVLDHRLNIFRLLISFHGLVQGTNAMKVISEVYVFFVLQCTVFGRKDKHKTDATAMESIFTKIIYEIFWSYETIMSIFTIFKIAFIFLGY